MPKYKPDNEDLYHTKPCAVCGLDVLDDDRETCSAMCQMQWEDFLYWEHRWNEEWSMKHVEEWLREMEGDDERPIT
jgi:hypothetical protein